MRILGLRTAKGAVGAVATLLLLSAAHAQTSAPGEDCPQLRRKPACVDVPRKIGGPKSYESCAKCQTRQTYQCTIYAFGRNGTPQRVPVPYDSCQ